MYKARVTCRQSMLRPSRPPLLTRPLVVLDVATRFVCFLFFFFFSTRQRETATRERREAQDEKIGEPVRERMSTQMATLLERFRR